MKWSIKQKVGAGFGMAQGLKTIPAVMVASSREVPDLIKSDALGVNAYVVKPVDFQQFIDAIRRLGFFRAILNEVLPTAGAR